MLLALAVSLAAAIIPTILYSLIFYLADRYEREPLWLVTVAFLWGAIPAIMISLIGENLIGATFVRAPSALSSALVEGVLVAPIIEEIAKGAALLALYLWAWREFDNVLDGVIYGALIGFGFAMTVNFLYYIGAFQEGGFVSLSFVIFLRSMLFGLNHAFYTSLTGIGFGLARRTAPSGVRALWIIAGLLAAIIVHSLHNLGAGLAAVNPLNFLMSLALAAVGLGVLISVIFLSWYSERQMLRTELAAEVGYTITAEEYRILTEEWHRPFHRRNKVANQNRRMHLSAELALDKRRLRELGSAQNPALIEEMDSIRAELLATV